MQGGITAIDLSPNSDDIVASAGRDHTVQIYDRCAHATKAQVTFNQYTASCSGIPMNQQLFKNDIHAHCAGSMALHLVYCKCSALNKHI